MPRDTILIVDDDPGSAATVEFALAAEGRFEFVAKRNGTQAWRWMDEQATPPAAVVTDLDMPGGDGYELMRKTRACTRYDATRIIVISGTCDDAARGRALELGADAFFAKPWSPLQLKRRLDELLYDSTGQSVSP